MTFLNKPTSTSVAAPTTKNKVSQSEPTTNDDGGVCHDLQARLDKLRKMWYMYEYLDKRFKEAWNSDFL